MRLYFVFAAQAKATDLQAPEGVIKSQPVSLVPLSCGLNISCIYYSPPTTAFPGSHSKGLGVPAHQCHHSICVHPVGVRSHHRVFVAHGYTGDHTTKVCLAPAIHLLLPEPIHPGSLAGHSTRLCRHATLHGCAFPRTGGVRTKAQGAVAPRHAVGSCLLSAVRGKETMLLHSARLKRMSTILGLN